jgi:4-hydroxy-2-oxoheptanedioate aldolase
MTATNPVKDRLANGGSVLGTWMQIPSPDLANVIASTGLDFVTIDMEHGAHSLETAATMLYAIESAGCHGMVRLGRDDATDIPRICDSGCQSILVAQCQSGAEADRIVRAMLYPPDGDRGLAPFTRLHGYSAEDLETKLYDANRRQLAGVLVEDREGLRNLDDIVETAGLDLVYLGIYDLSQSLGLAGQVDHPDVVDTVREAVETINASGLAAGAVARDAAHLVWLLDAGFRYVSYLCDTAIIAEGFRGVRSTYDALARIAH